MDPEQEPVGDEEPWSWDKRVDLLISAYASCRQEEEDFWLAFLDEDDFDPAIFLNANLC